MNFFETAVMAVGFLGLAYGAADMLRHYLPNYYRVFTPVLILGAADAYIPYFDFMTWGFQVGLAVGITGLMLFLRRGRVRRQDGTIDNGDNSPYGQG